MPQETPAGEYPLPEGVRLVSGPDGQPRLEFASEELRQAYRMLTDGPPVEVSRYLFEVWLPEMGPDLFVLLLVLRELQRKHPGEGIFPEQLARASGLPVETVVDYLERRYRNTKRYDSPGWQAFRRYVGREPGPPEGGSEH